MTLAPGESHTASFDNGFDLEVVCTSDGGAELTLSHTTEWYWNGGLNSTTGPMVTLDTAAPPALNPPASGLAVHNGGDYLALGLDGAIFELESYLLVLSAPDGLNRECVFGGFAAAGGSAAG